jgi:hypothetical protein
MTMAILIFQLRRLERTFCKEVTLQKLGENKFVIFTPAIGHAIIDNCRGLTRFI